MCYRCRTEHLNEGELTRREKRPHLALTKEIVKKRNIKDVKEIFVASLDARGRIIYTVKRGMEKMKRS